MLVARKWEKKVKKNQTTDKRKMDWKALQNSVNFILNSFRSNLCFIKFMLYLEHLNIYFSCGLNMMVDWKKKWFKFLNTMCIWCEKCRFVINHWTSMIKMFCEALCQYWISSWNMLRNKTCSWIVLFVLRWFSLFLLNMI
jgi:hypothetical protein